MRVQCPAIRHLRHGDRACDGVLTMVPPAWRPAVRVLPSRNHATGEGELHPCPLCGSWTEIRYEGLRAA